MVSLEEITHNYDSNKWQHFWDIFDYHFSSLRDKQINLLEIGVRHSIGIWEEYFPNAQIIGIDTDKNSIKTQKRTAKRAEIYQGDATQKKDIEQIIKKYNNFDIIIDDGSHINVEQQKTINLLFPCLNKKGIYVIEDLHTSYLDRWNSINNYQKQKNLSIIDFLKQLIDKIHYHVYGKELEWDFDKEEQQNLIKKIEGICDCQDDIWENTVNSIHFYPGIVMIYKK